MINIQQFPVAEFRQTDFQSFINYWSRYYNYKPEHENEFYHIPIASTTLNRNDLLKLFEWKNGSVLSARKAKSFNDKIISRLSELNEIKSRGIESVKDVQKIRPDLSAIWLIFLTHIIDKQSFPIFDMHVFRAYNYLTTNTILEISNNDTKKLLQYDSYLSYYNALKPQIKDYKKWDEAMWAFGKFLSRYKPFNS